MASTNPTPLSIPVDHRHLPPEGRRGGHGLVTSTPVLEHGAEAGHGATPPHRLGTPTVAALLVGAVAVACVLSVVVGARSIPLAADLGRVAPAAQHLPGPGRADPARPRGGRGPRPRRRGAAGPHAQPAGRPGDPGHQRRRQLRHGRRALRLRGLRAARLPVGRLPRRGGGRGAGPRHRLRRARRRHPDEARHRRRRPDRSHDQLDDRRPARRPPDDGDLPLLAGGHDRRPRPRASCSPVPRSCSSARSSR